MGQERVRAVLAALGHPEAGLTGALVAGTNGKGSTCAILSSILEAGGLRVGMMPKPHLSSYAERIQVDGRPIPEAEFAAAVNAVRPRLEAVAGEMGEPTEFEILTALAIAHLAPRVDRLVCEVGMGGRLDATNVLDLGVAVITNVALDHQRYLGDTIPEIAAEKAAIVKPGDVAVTGCRPPALAVVESAAARAGARLWRLGEEIRLEARSLGWEGVALDVEGPAFSHRELRLALVGLHQAENAALAVAAAHAAGDATAESVRRGLAQVAWPGRLERLGGRPSVVLDGGHNPDGLARAGVEVRRLVGEGRLVIVFAAMGDKDLPALVRALRTLEAEVVVFTAAASAAERAADPHRLRDLYGSGRVVLPAVDALGEAVKVAGRAGTVLVCGSLYLVGEVRPHLLPAGGKGRS
ncbi:MAG: bifunctional folylpolyglutamate synthase/dihydrofolate synthase [Candidatus Dormibacterales bacterium]